MALAQRTAPTLEAAQRAAEAVAAQGAVRVLLFGSLARGASGPDSDIDLVAIFADLGDYSERCAVRHRLEEAAQAAAGHPVDLHVTDFPEWTKRTTEVTASFEASITGETVVLADRELSVTPDWGKEIGLKDNNLDEAGQRFGDIGTHCRELANHLLPDEFEVMADASDSEPFRLNRMRQICGDASRVIENALKTLVALEGTSPLKVHDINDLLAQMRDRRLAEGVRRSVAGAGLTAKGITDWHVNSNYANDVEVQWAKAEADKTAMVNLAGACALAAADAYRAAGGDPQLLRMLQKAMDRIERDGPDALGAVPVFTPLGEPGPSIKSGAPPVHGRLAAAEGGEVK